MTTHYSPLSGIPGIEKNYHTVRYDLINQGNATIVTLTQDNNRSEDERKHSEENWNIILEKLKSLLE